jgi:hypothetical protein
MYRSILVTAPHKLRNGHIGREPSNSQTGTMVM